MSNICKYQWLLYDETPYSSFCINQLIVRFKAYEYTCVALKTTTRFTISQSSQNLGVVHGQGRSGKIILPVTCWLVDSLNEMLVIGTVNLDVIMFYHILWEDKNQDRVDTVAKVKLVWFWIMKQTEDNDTPHCRIKWTGDLHLFGNWHIAFIVVSIIRTDLREHR